jgi:preprotein translocase subunit SecG
LLTRATTILAALFIVMSILLAVLAAGTNKARVIDPTVAAKTAPIAPAPGAPAPAAPTQLPGLPGVPVAQ